LDWNLGAAELTILPNPRGPMKGCASMHGSSQKAFVLRVERTVKVIARRRKFAAADGHVPRRLDSDADSAAGDGQDFDNDVVADQYLLTVPA
jgi:hypothetical protein